MILYLNVHLKLVKFQIFLSPMFQHNSIHKRLRMRKGFQSVVRCHSFTHIHIAMYGLHRLPQRLHPVRQRGPTRWDTTPSKGPPAWDDVAAESGENVMDVGSEGCLSNDRLQEEVNIGLDTVKETGQDGDLSGDEVLEMVEGFWRWRWQWWDTGEFFLQ